MTRRMILVGWAMALAGCGGAAPAPLRPQEFLGDGHPGMEPGMINRQTDQNGTLVYGDLHAPLLPDEYSDNPKNKTPTPISPLLQKAMAASQPVHSIAATEPASRPATLAAPGLASTYQIVGTVIAILNGRPIYADKVIASIEPQLAAKARLQDPGSFRDEAQHAIEDQVRSMVDSERYVAAANEFLSADSKLQADQYAAYWRREQITDAGGSLEAAKEKTLREFRTTLDERVRDERDRYLVRLYFEQRVTPLIQVTPADMRQYYQQNLAAEFTQTAAVKFHLIKIDIAGRGGPEKALALVHQILGWLREGKEFSQVAKSYNDDPTLMQSGGVVAGGEWVQKGSYVNEHVEDEVWKLRPGEPAEIEDRQSSPPAFYIAQLDAKKPGAVQRFDDQDVQMRIHATLWNRQFAVLQEKIGAKLAEQKFAPLRPDWLETTVDMAMQLYPLWAAGK